MKILIELPDVFAVHYDSDKFKDSMSRITCDVSHFPAEGRLSGRYEWELARELTKAFESSRLVCGVSDEEQMEEYERLFNFYVELAKRHEAMTGERVDVLHREGQ